MHAALRLYNSLTREKELYQPLVAGKTGMYVCGMTVYDFCHIGHARVMVVFDTLARHLRASGYDLRYVRNITDIDDKIIARAAENGESIEQLTARFIVAMHEDEAALEPKATESIAAMQTLIATLIEKGYAYVAENGDVYYRVRQFADYGKLANRSLEDLRAGERIAINEAKEDPLDFVLWKAAKAGEPSWDSPWGAGRPGWHIECSAMSNQSLGEHFDIHGGGMDLKFPHHECEIAQSEGACGHRHVNYWVHNGFVQIDNEKMSKSLGNFFTVRDVLKQYKGEVIRFFMLQTHYRAPLNYSDAGLNEAKKALTRLYSALDGKTCEAEIDAQSLNAFCAAMNDDLNTAKALSVLFELARRINSGENTLATTLKHLGARLGILQEDAAAFLKGEASSCALDAAAIEALIAERAAAKAAKNYVRADEIRQQLAEQGVILKDSPTGCEWSYQ